jgi:methylthioribose-1-phosphate isomerase
MRSSSEQYVRTLHWEGDARGQLRLLDQTLLPTEVRDIVCKSADDVWHAIKRLSVRGAPAIGCAAAYGAVLGTQVARELDRPQFLNQLRQVCDYLAGSRPTAVNLFWALDRMRRTAELLPPTTSAAVMHDRLLNEAQTLEREDRDMCAAIGRHGAALVPHGAGILTHCNAGGLATAGDGTALAVIFAAAAAGKGVHAYADETRPLLQGARLTAWELQRRGVPVTLICDSMAARVMQEGKVQLVITGADRIAANGDTANKIGTYSVALLAQAHGIPFYIAAPSSTFDLSLADGTHIPIEERAAEEITHGFGRQTAPEGVQVYNPAFDVTPARLIAGIITERGVITPVDTATIRRMIAPTN